MPIDPTYVTPVHQDHLLFLALPFAAHLPLADSDEIRLFCTQSVQIAGSKIASSQDRLASAFSDFQLRQPDPGECLQTRFVA